MAARPSGPQDQVEKERETGAERGDPTPSSNTESSPPGSKKEMDGALGVPGGQPDVSPSGPVNNNTPEPKVKIIFHLSWARVIINALSRLISLFASRVIFVVKINLYNSPCL